MTLNFPGPYEVEFEYQFSGMTHLQRVNCTIPVEPSIGDEFTDINVMRKGGTTDTLANVVDEYTDVFLPLVTGGCELIGATLWKYTTGTYERTFKATYAIGAAGTGVGTVQAASQNIYTFRTQAGGRMKATLLECIGDGLTEVAYGALAGANLAFMNYFLSANCAWHGRDNYYAAVPLRLLQGQNEAIFKKRYRGE